MLNGLHISFHQIFSKWMCFIVSKTTKVKLKKYLRRFRLAILFATFLYYLYLYTQMILEFKDRYDYPEVKKFTLRLTEPEIQRLAICIDINILGNQRYADFKPTKTLLEIEKETNGKFNSTIADIYFEYLNKRIDAQWTASPKVAFKKDGYFYRCFEVRLFSSEVIYPQVHRYQNLLSILKLVIKYKEPYFKLFLLSKDEMLSSNSYLLANGKEFEKSLKKI